MHSLTLQSTFWGTAFERKLYAGEQKLAFTEECTASLPILLLATDSVGPGASVEENWSFPFSSWMLCISSAYWGFVQVQICTLYKYDYPSQDVSLSGWCHLSHEGANGICCFSNFYLDFQVDGRFQVGEVYLFFVLLEHTRKYT